MSFAKYCALVFGLVMAQNVWAASISFIDTTDNIFLTFAGWAEPAPGEPQPQSQGCDIQHPLAEGQGLGCGVDILNIIKDPKGLLTTELFFQFDLTEQVLFPEDTPGKVSDIVDFIVNQGEHPGTLKIVFVSDPDFTQGQLTTTPYDFLTENGDLQQIPLPPDLLPFLSFAFDVFAQSDVMRGDREPGTQPGPEPGPGITIPEPSSLVVFGSTIIVVALYFLVGAIVRRAASAPISEA